MADVPLRQFDRGRETRAQGVWATALAWIEKTAKYMRRDMVMAHQRIDEVLIHWLCSQVAIWYSAITGFVWAHGFFLFPLCVTWGRALEQRKSCCMSCNDRKVDDLQVARCFGYPGGSCGCPQKWWWVPGYLWWQQLLRNRVCPKGFFGRFFRRGASDGD